MKKKAALTLIGVLFIAGCSGSGSTGSATQISGAVADGYLQNALVFLDKNRNYQLDPGEPSTTTDANGAYTLNVAPEDVGIYPIVALAIEGQTIDADTPGVPLTSTYVLCTPGAAVSGTVNNFISPFSTLIREKLEANPGMTVADAITQLRNQLNMPAGVNMMGNYVAGSASGLHGTEYQEMHQVARQMAGLMAEQSALVMNGRSVNTNNFRSMMGEINDYLPQIADNAIGGEGMNSVFMNTMRARMQTAMESLPAYGGFRNYSATFRSMTSVTYFWNFSGGRMQPRGGTMRGGMGR
ncbi:hypothetical protein [Geobacter sp. DSM 9736]|uniref:hypothetical protein n=1 Tax=Geobacter sp. DSM 9736 TaxID=1277350 RepID=UPI000B50DA34|nr:hypothetical protein [Geobacter sp. DSM 9736]SNB45708.1 hypothetical protein SAMN06269301_1136 [Geobacter sp. DSM 9736]